jgi:hypothetical protein
MFLDYLYLFNIKDWGSKKVWSFPIKDKKPNTIINCLDDLIICDKP